MRNVTPGYGNTELMGRIVNPFVSLPSLRVEALTLVPHKGGDGERSSPIEIFSFYRVIWSFRSTRPSI